MVVEDPGLAGVYRFTGDIWVRRGRLLLAWLAGAGVAAPSPRPCCWRPSRWRCSTTTGPRLGRVPDGQRGGGAARLEMGSAAPTSGPRWPAPGRRTWWASGQPPTSRPAGTTGSRPAAPARTRSAWSMTASGTRSLPSWPRWARARRCWWTRSTSPARSAPRWSWPGPGWARSAIDSGDLPLVARQVRELLDQLGARDTKIVLSGDLNEYSIARWPPPRSTGTGSGPPWSPGPGPPPRRWSTSSWPGPGKPPAGGRWSRWPSGRSASRAGAAGSGRPGSSTRTAWRSPS